MIQLLNKMANILANPLLVIFLLLCCAVFFGVIKWRRLSWVFLTSTMLLMAMICFTPFSNMIILPLEERFARSVLPNEIDGIISIGGGLEPKIAFGRNGVEQANASDRLYETAVLARRFPNAKIVYTGATWVLEGKEFASGEIAKRYFTGLGIEKDRIVLENKSRNTFDNVVLSKSLVKPKQDEIWVAVTSSYHMPRTIGIFRAQNWQVIPWPSDYQTHGTGAATDFSYSAMSNLETLHLAMNEWLGLLAYKLLGRTNELFPSQALGQN